MLNGELKASGVHVGIVEIMGIVGIDEHFAPDKIAEAYWTLHVERDRVEYIFDWEVGTVNYPDLTLRVTFTLLLLLFIVDTDIKPLPMILRQKHSTREPQRILKHCNMHRDTCKSEAH